MFSTERAWEIFNRSIRDYHKTDSVDSPEQNPFKKGELEWFLYSKSWIDTVQWHLEDLIRDENISPSEALKIKRRIDASNQKRTDLVEYIDSYFFDQFKEIKIKADARLNTETPAWAIDRLSILALKIYHMKAETERTDAGREHLNKCLAKLQVLELQKKDLSTAIEELFSEIRNGKIQMKMYKQMKMYNDADLNPVLYQKK